MFWHLQIQPGLKSYMMYKEKCLLMMKNKLYQRHCLETVNYPEFFSLTIKFKLFNLYLLHRNHLAFSVEQFFPFKDCLPYRKNLRINIKSSYAIKESTIKLLKNWQWINIVLSLTPCAKTKQHFVNKYFLDSVVGKESDILISPIEHLQSVNSGYSISIWFHIHDGFVPWHVSLYIVPVKIKFILLAFD